MRWFFVYELWWTDPDTADGFSIRDRYIGKFMNNVFDVSSRLTALEESLRFVSANFNRSYESLYDFLGQCHLLTLDIGADSTKIKRLMDVLDAEVSRASGITKRQVKLATSVASKLALYVFRRDEREFVSSSTRSNYTRALVKAAEDGLSVDAFINRLRSDGLVAFLSGGKKQEGDDSAIDVARTELMTKTAKSVKPIGLIDNRNPRNTFAVVLYRVDSGKLVPCFVSDDDSAVNAVVAGVTKLERKLLEQQAEEAAERARQEVLNSRKAA